MKISLCQLHIYTVLQLKQSLWFLCRCRLILKIISLADSQRNCVCIFDRNFHLTSTTLLLYLVTFLCWVFHFPVGRGSGTSRTRNRQNAESNDARTLFHTFCGRRTVPGPDLQNILCQSFDYFTTVPKLR